jgi:hypothetical protein
MGDKWTIEAVDPRDSVATTLIAALTQELARIYPMRTALGTSRLRTSWGLGVCFWSAVWRAGPWPAALTGP